MNKLIIFAKLQYKLLILLLVIAPLPLYYLLSLDLKIPYLPYFFLILLFAIKMLTFNTDSKNKRINQIASNSLEKEIGKKPSKQLIINRVREYYNGRDMALVISGLCVIFISIFFKAF